MKLDDRLEIRPVVANAVPLAGGNRMHGDVYDTIADMRAAHPDSVPMFGAIVADAATGLVADGYDDWYPAFEDAYQAWAANALPHFRIAMEYDPSAGLMVEYGDGADGGTYPVHTVDGIVDAAKTAVQAVLSKIRE